MIKHEKNDKGDVKETLSHSIISSKHGNSLEGTTQPSAVGSMVEESQHFMNEDMPLPEVSETYKDTGELYFFIVDTEDSKKFDVIEFTMTKFFQKAGFGLDIGEQFLENVLEYGYEASSKDEKGYVVCLAPVEEDFSKKNLVVIASKEGRYFASGVRNLHNVTFSSIMNTKEPVLLERIDFSGKVTTWAEVKLSK